MARRAHLKQALIMIGKQIIISYVFLFGEYSGWSLAFKLEQSCPTSGPFQVARNSLQNVCSFFKNEVKDKTWLIVCQYALKIQLQLA